MYNLNLTKQEFAVLTYVLIKHRATIQNDVPADVRKLYESITNKLASAAEAARTASTLCLDCER